MTMNTSSSFVLRLTPFVSVKANCKVYGEAVGQNIGTSSDGDGTLFVRPSKGLPYACL